MLLLFLGELQTTTIPLPLQSFIFKTLCFGKSQMANIPQPRTFTQILDDLFTAFLSKTELRGIRLGSPIIPLFESVAQITVKSSADIFNSLSSVALKRAEDDALDKIGSDEDIPLPRQGAKASSGLVTISDTSFTKKNTKVWSGNNGATAGATVIFVDDASVFPAVPFSIYIGRGTSVSEGPLVVNTKTNLGSYWSLTLSSATSKYHNVGEEVVLSQGGDRVVAGGTTVRVPQSILGQAISFNTLSNVTIADGETSVENVPVVAQIPGNIGNIGNNTLVEFQNIPFTGATVTNPKPFVNGKEIETDRDYRNRIAEWRQSKSLGTSTAIINNLTGVSSNDRSITSVSVFEDDVNRQATTVIDDGTGYEEEYVGVPFEIIESNASGGETLFSVSGTRPYAEARVVSELSGPFLLVNNSVLTVNVNSKISQHVFSAADFNNILLASGYEIAASINKNYKLNFKAKTIESGTKVVLVPKDPSDKFIQVISGGANTSLKFSENENTEIRLYKNDRLLSSGKYAEIYGNIKSAWGVMSGSQTLDLSIDGGPVITYTLIDSDFLTSGYTTLSHLNPIESWATALKYRIPGIDVTTDSNRLVIKSLRGKSDISALNITGGSLVSSGLFNIGSITGQNTDYIFNRTTGQISLTTPLETGDKLTAATSANQAFVDSTSFSVISGTSGDLWLVIDGDVEMVDLTLGQSTAVTMTDTAKAWGRKVTFTADTSSRFLNAKAGDWLLITNSGYNANNQGAFRISDVRAFGLSGLISIDRNASPTIQSVNVSDQNFQAIRTTKNIIKINIPTGTNYTPAALAEIIDTALAGAARCIAINNRYVRIQSNKFKNGEIAVIAATGVASSLGFTTGVYSSQDVSHVGVLSSSEAYVLPKNWNKTLVNTAVSISQFTTSSGIPALTGSVIGYGISDPDFDAFNPLTRTPNLGHKTPVVSVSGTTVDIRNPVLKEITPSSTFREYYPVEIGANDSVSIVVDNDENTKRYTPNLYRKVKPTTNTYSVTQNLTDSENSNLSLASAFGTDFIFNDFKIMMKARCKSSRTALGADTTSTILWRSKQFGTSGEAYRLRYVLPTVPNAALNIAVGNPSSFTVPIDVTLPSGASRVGPTVRNGSRVGLVITTSGSNHRLSFILGFPISTAVRRVQVPYGGRNNVIFSGVVTGATSGATGTVFSDTLPGGFTGSGILLLTGVAGAFIPGETITGGGASATTNTGSEGRTVATLDLTGTNATEHGLNVGDKIWVNSTDINFSSGLKYILEVTPTTITYSEGVTSVGATASIGTVSNDDTGFVSFTGSTVVVNDYFSLLSPSIPALTRRTMRVSTLGTQYFTGLVETSGSVNTVPVWYSIVNAGTLSWFAPVNPTAAAIATSVNAITSSPVTAVAVGDGIINTGTVSLPWWEDTTFSVWSAFVDGINYVQSHTTPPDTLTNYQFTFKNSISSFLGSNSDWANEELRIVPFTVVNTVDWLNSYATSGLSAVATVRSVNSDTAVQINSNTLGSLGSISIQGGVGNALSFSLVNAVRSVDTDQMVRIDVLSSLVAGISGSSLLELKTGTEVTKQLGPSVQVQSLTASGILELTSNAWNYATVTAAPITGRGWVVEKAGNFLSFRWETNSFGSSPAAELATVQIGDWVQIEDTENLVNNGLFQIVSKTSTGFVVYNESGVQDAITSSFGSATLTFLRGDLLLPGDIIVINSDVLGQANIGEWVVDSIGSTTTRVQLQTIRNPVAYTGPSVPVHNFAQFINRRVLRHYGRVVSVVNYDNDNSYVFIKRWSDETLSARDIQFYGPNSSTTLSVLNKLNLPQQTVERGVDGYVEGSGLLAEAAKVLYGMEEDRNMYPGVAAEGSDNVLSGPVIKPFKLSLAVRTDLPLSSVSNIIKDSVISVVESSKNNEILSISQIIEAVEQLSSIYSVVVLSPQYDLSNDVVIKQKFEKLFVVSREDIKVSLIGE